MRAPSPYRINFLVQFSVQYIYITRFFKTVFHFFLLLWGFWEMSKSLAQRVIVQSHLKRMLDSWRFKATREKADTVLISVHLSWTAEDCKAMLFGTWSSPSTTHSSHLKKQDRNFTSLVALTFLPDLMFYYLIFHLPNFLIALINQMIGSSPALLCKKTVVL